MISESPLIVAHRGAHKQALENTLKAFDLAWKQGADAIEGDFHLTSDHQIVCYHDKNIKTFSIEKHTLEELRTLDKHIPVLNEVLKRVPAGKYIYIEVKSDEKIVPYLLKEIKKSHLKAEQVIVISFNVKVIQECKMKAPHIKALWLYAFARDAKPVPEQILETLGKLHADGLSTNRTHVDESFVHSIIAAGYEYHVWTINNTDTALDFKKWGVRSITTDDVGKIKQCLYNTVL